MDIRCARCGASFSCESGLSCWCMTPPHIPMPQGDETCLCPACLDAARAAAKTGPNPSTPGMDRRRAS